MAIIEELEQAKKTYVQPDLVKDWSPDELDTLDRYFHKVKLDLLKKHLPGRSASAIRKRGLRLRRDQEAKKEKPVEGKKKPSSPEPANPVPAPGDNERKKPDHCFSKGDKVAIMKGYHKDKTGTIQKVVGKKASVLLQDGSITWVIVPEEICYVPC